MTIRFSILLALSLALPGCGAKSYDQVATGKFSGVLEVRWLASNEFLFLPNQAQPLTFTRANGEIIKPGIMTTDAGSVPRIFWSLEGLSPWGFAPAYMIHDWVFAMHHCEATAYSFDDSALIMAETLKTLMEAGTKPANLDVFNAIVTATASPIARQVWSNGECEQVALDPYSVTTRSSDPNKGKEESDSPGELLMRIDFN